MKIIKADKAPAAVGPYSAAIAHNGLLFCSGQIPLDPKTMELVEPTIEAQTQGYSRRKLQARGHGSARAGVRHA